MGKTSLSPNATDKPKPCPRWGSLTAAKVLEKWATTRPDTVFLRPSGRPAMTFAEANADVVRLSNGLRAQGLGPGDSLLLRAGRRPEGFIMLVAAIRAGLHICIAPEGMSARQVTEGAVSYAPKLAVDAGVLPQDDPNALRILDMAANLFTIRLVGCFGDPPDGFLDLASFDAPVPNEDALPTIDPEQDAIVHMLRHNADGKMERLSRSQSQLLTQAMACAMASDVSASSVVGMAYDTIGSHGLLAGALPALLVGCGVQLFEAVDPNLDTRMRLWQAESDANRLVLPAALTSAPGLVSKDPAPHRVWISDGAPSTTIPNGDRLLVDCGGTALLPAGQDNEGQCVMRPGSVTLGPSTGGAMTFGTLRLEGGPQDNSSSGSLMTGEICLESPLVAARDGKIAEPQPTGQMARLAEDTDHQPIYVLTDKDANAIQVGGRRVMLSVINRALGLTGRWQDAAVFAVPDTMMGSRIEVAVEPRAGDGEARTLPTLDMVRTMLRESGIGDAGLPVKLHLVRRVPRRGRGIVDVAAVSEHLFDPTAEDAESTEAQAVA